MSTLAHAVHQPIFPFAHPRETVIHSGCATFAELFKQSLESHEKVVSALEMLHRRKLVLDFRASTHNDEDDEVGKDIAAIRLPCHKHWFALQVGISKRALRRHLRCHPHRFTKFFQFGPVGNSEPVVLFPLRPTETVEIAFERLFDPIMAHLQNTC